MGTRWAVVTGGAQGIGRAVTFALRDAGYEVVVVDCDGEAVAEIASPSHAVVADVADPDIAAHLTATLGVLTDHLELVVHNAGISLPSSLRTPDPATFDRVLAVNLRAPYVISGVLLPWLLRGDHPSIIHVASTRAFMSEPDTEPYAASKGGLLALTHAMAVSLGPVVRVNAVSPGWIATEAWQKAGRRRMPDLSPVDHRQHPAGRVGTPEDVARAVLFLADPANDFITGANLIVDGGMTRKMIYAD
jgi:NAD(P)-dependent dehydrogenase (short-subunit alcohol dehydrogenase family)